MWLPIRRTKYVRLLKILDRLARKMKSVPAAPGQDEAGTSTRPAPKKRKVSTKAKTGKRTFYAAPSKMNDRAPKSAK